MTNSKHDLPVAANLLNQDFAATAPNQAWWGDITHIATDEGWLYFAGLKVLFGCELVGCTTSGPVTEHLVMQALFPARLHRTRISGARRPILHAGVNESTRKLR
jgi:putative transposase